MKDRFGDRLDTASDGRNWVAFSDVALSILFVFLVFIFAQFVYYQKIAVNEELERRQSEIRHLLRDSIPPSFRESLSVDSGSAFSQRVTFASDLLFEPCRDNVTVRGDSLVVLVGGLLQRRVSYFETIEVEGHTDRRNPRGPPSCPFRDNWELSSRRAATVVRTLQQDTGIQPQILSAVGKGQFHPESEFDPDVVLDAEDMRWADSALAADRRIELLLQYSEGNILDSLNSL